MADSNASAQRFDPHLAFCFAVKIEVAGIAETAYFKSVGGLKYESEVVDYKEGGYNIGTRRLVGPAKWVNLVLKRGFSGPPNNQLLEWRRQWLVEGAQGEGALARADGEIHQLDSKMNKVCAWKFYRGWPCKWEISEYDASKSEIVIETCEIAHEGIEFLG